MAEGTTSTKKAVTTENLAALKDVLATKSHVTAQLGGGVEFATDEEVLALFQETTPADTPVE